ncbi:restriction endonuclease subunit S [archaeon]|jgi:type I restriction enzyme, S subunit|nr:restriction endonuclease subunit S [archaeon]
MSEGWEEVKLVSLCIKIQSGGTPKSDNIEFYQGDMPFVAIHDITSSNKYLWNTKKHITDKAVKLSSTWKVPKNSILYTIYATLGEVVINKIDVTTNQAILNIIPNKNIDLEFFYYVLKYFKREIYKHISQTTQKNLNATIVKDFDINIPKSLQEQQKIADILTKVDETIEFTEKIIEKDERIKKGLMQDLFSKGIDEKENLRNEETHEFKPSDLEMIPKEWDVETLSPNFAKITTGNKDTQDRNNDGLYPFFVRSNTIERINSYSYDGEAILTSGDGVGVGKIYHYVNCKFDFHQRVYMLYNFKKDISGKYLFYYFRENFYNEIAKDSAKTTVDSVRLHMIADMKIPKPKLQEQEKIASILSSIDSKIQKEKQELNKLKSIKEGLMQDLLTGNKQKEVTCMIKEAVV